MSTIYKITYKTETSDHNGVCSPEQGCEYHVFENTTHELDDTEICYDYLQLMNDSEKIAQAIEQWNDPSSLLKCQMSNDIYHAMLFLQKSLPVPDVAPLEYSSPCCNGGPGCYERGLACHDYRLTITKIERLDNPNDDEDDEFQN